MMAERSGEVSFIASDKNKKRTLRITLHWRHSGAMRKNLGNDQRLERCNLRLSEDIISSIDTARTRRAGFVSRNSWIAEAILDKLSKEGIAASQNGRTRDDA